MKDTNIVRSIDVGYRNTKFTVSGSADRDVNCRLFPSRAPLATAVDLSGGVLDHIDTVAVAAEGNSYQVGPDVELALATHNAPVLHKNFTGTPEYLALVHGAIHYMDVPHLDLLVAGLPVSLLEAKATLVRERLQGTHEITHGRTVVVDRVLVLAQPIGGLINHALLQGTYDRLRTKINLIIDPGFLTLDWVVTKGIQPMPRRSGSFAGGMHAVLRTIAQAISREHRIDYEDYAALDCGLRSGEFMLYGNAVALAPYLAAAKPVIDEAVNALSNSVGDGRDIDNIVLVGGGAWFFRAAIEHRFPSHHVHLADDAVFANVRGFQHAGEELMRRIEVDVA